jgi:transglutaminase-like putative cysteine protease
MIACLGLFGASHSPAHADLTESWDAVFMGGVKVGQIHIFIEPVTDKGRKLIRVRVDTTIRLKRQNDQVTLELQYGTIETPDGEVLRLDTRTVAADTIIRAHGDVVDGKMVMNFRTGDNVQKKTIDWGADVRGPYAAEQSMARSPMTEGEVRSLKMFMPDLNEICDIKLTAGKKEEVALGGGAKRTLLRVEQTTSLDGKARSEFDSTMFVDEKGQVLKSESDLMGGMVLYRTTKQGAILPSTTVTANQFDQIARSVIKVVRPIKDSEKTRDIRYRISLKNGNPADVLPTDRRQTVNPGSKESEVILEVKTAGRKDGQAETPPTSPEYLEPNALINSDDPKIVELMRKAVGNATNPWEKASKIERWVAENIRDKNFKTAFAPASEVAVNLSGDCTEHGVLTAAMCRAAGIPSRVVVGLVYASELKGFGYHMWNEVFVDGRWVAIDATFAQDEVDAVHIKLSESSLKGVAPFEALLPIVRVLGKMSIEPIEIR